MKLFPSLAIASALALGACSTSQVSETETYASQVLAGLAAVLAAPAIQADLGPNLARAEAALADAKLADAVLTGSASSLITATSQTAVQQIGTDTTTIISLIQEVPGLPSSVSTILTAVDVVVPIMLASVDIQTPAKGTPGGMSLPQAQSILTNPNA